MRLGDCAGQEVPMAIAVLAGFSYLLNFARAIPVYGPYVVMISNVSLSEEHDNDSNYMACT